MAEEKLTFGAKAMLAFLVIGIAFATYKSFISEETETNNPSKGLKDISSLKEWAKKDIVDDFCERYAKAKSYNNETKRERELSYVEDSRLRYVPQRVRNVVEENDLPDSFADELYEYVEQEISNCD